MNKLFTIGIVCITVTIFYGFSSLSYKTNTLSAPQMLCCNRGGCEDEHRRCTDRASVEIKPNCFKPIPITCYECVNIILQLGNQVCLEPPPTYCILGDGVTRYYGGPNPLKLEK